MSDCDNTRAELVELSRWLGAEERDCVILGEGNTSARLDGDTFLVKASGCSLGSIGAEGFVAMRRSAVLALIEPPSTPSNDAMSLLRDAKVDPEEGGDPSVETPLHALCLGLPGVRVVGHTHPTAINAIACARGFEQALSRRVFADQVVACGPRSLQVPYAEPGIELGRVLHRELSRYLGQWGEPPKTIYLRNHGFVALGATTDEVKALTLMAIKAARILLGTMACGGPHELPVGSVDPHPPHH